MRLTFLAPLFAVLAAPALGQSYWLPPDFSGPPIAPGEAGIGVPLPGATPTEQRANIAWQMRAALNVAALQCQNDRTLLVDDAYNGVLVNHKEELAKVYSTLQSYFRKQNKNPRVAQDAMDRFGTKTYSGVSAVHGIRGFCQTASRLGQRALFTPRGSFTVFAIEHLREIRNSLNAVTDQQFRTVSGWYAERPSFPSFDGRCWRKGEYDQRCGVTYG